MTPEPLIGWKPKDSDPAVASVRIRCLNPLRELARRGVPVEVFRRDHASKYTVVVYSKLYDARSFEEAATLKERGVRIVFDLCDNHFAPPPDRHKLVARAALLRCMLVLADDLVASTEALAHAMQAELPVPRPITVIGDAIESELAVPAWPPWRNVEPRRRLRRLRARIERWQAEGRTPLVWFGNHGGPYADCGITDLQRVREVIEGIDARHPVSLTVISNDERKFRREIARWSVPTRYLAWDAATFLDALKAHAIALIPITPNAFTRCKSNNRLILALTQGLAVVADSIPSYAEFRGVAALDDWEHGLERLLADPARRARDVEAGRALVAQRWTLPTICDQWERFLRRAIEAPRTIAAAGDGAAVAASAGAASSSMAGSSSAGSTASGRAAAGRSDAVWVPDRDTLRRRAYASYDEYVAHQAAKLGRLDLRGYDADYRRALRERLAALGLPRAGESVLCLGARIGTECKAFIDRGCFAVGIDLNPGAGNRHVVHGDFHELQFADASVDCVFTNALDHALELERVIGEAARVLKPGGVWIAEVVGGSKDDHGREPGEYEALWWDHVADVYAAIQRHGFALEKQQRFTYPWSGELVVFRRPAATG